MVNNSINIAIADDHTLFRQGLSNLLSDHPGFYVLFEASNGQDIQAKIRQYGIPDIILMDINMPLMNGHEATQLLKAMYPLVHVLALSMYEDEQNIIKILRKGASGYVLKECHSKELIRAIQSVVDTGYYINELVSGKLLHSIKENQNEGIVQTLLTPKEQIFLKYCCTEFTYKEIAEKMKVSPRTIDGYREQLFEKLQLKSRTGLVLYAIKTGLVLMDS